MKLQWKPIKNYEKTYFVSNTGLVKNIKNDRLLKPSKTERGYLRVSLWDNDKKERKYKRVHRLVADAFLRKVPNKNEINHKDENKENNVVCNLEWCNHEQNIQHSLNSGKIPTTKVMQYTKDGKLVATFSSASEAERKTKIPRTHICKVVLGRYGFSSAGGFIWKGVNNGNG